MFRGYFVATQKKDVVRMKIRFVNVVFFLLVAVSFSNDFAHAADLSPQAKLTTAAEQLSPSELNLRVAGTQITNTGVSFAIMENLVTREQDVFDPNDMVFGQAKLVKVTQKGVVLDNNGTLEFLALRGQGYSEWEEKKKESSTVKHLLNGAMASGPLEVDNDLKNPSRILDRAKLLSSNLSEEVLRARPKLVTTKAGGVGIKLQQLEESSIIADAGIEAGDVIESINGQVFDNPLELPRIMYKEIKFSKSISFGINRNGKLMSLAISSRFNDAVPQEEIQPVESLGQRLTRKTHPDETVDLFVNQVKDALKSPESLEQN